MRCLFCKSVSSQSRSVEHILLESLGNKSHTLPQGVVCDGCNNYFSHSVEKPFLDAPAIRNLRFWERLESKKKRVPSIAGLIMPNVPVTATHDVRLDLLRVEVPEAYVEPVLKAKTGKLILPTAGLMPKAQVTSRFVAKVALEAMAACICEQPGGIDYLVDESQLDAIRDHARKGKVISWPVKIRKIYAADASVLGADGLDGQIVNEWDFLQTPANEWYFVLAIFGVEFAINMGGPDIEGYNAWLQENGDESPLYVGKNSVFKKPS